VEVERVDLMKGSIPFRPRPDSGIVGENLATFPKTAFGKNARSLWWTGRSILEYSEPV
jgi:hypothetical protein